MMVTHDGGGRGARASMKDRLCVCVVARLCACTRACVCVSVCMRVHACDCAQAQGQGPKQTHGAKWHCPCKGGFGREGQKNNKKKSELLCDVLKAKCVTGGEKKKKIT